MDPGINLRMKIRKEVYGRADQGDTANEGTVQIVELFLKNLKKYLKTTANRAALPDPTLLVRSANRRRSKQFPPNPRKNDPNFDFNQHLSQDNA